MTHVDTPQSGCRCGVARRDVTPPVGIYHRMWGAAAHDRSIGVHRPLTATALVVKPRGGNEQQIIVAVDHCLLFDHDMRVLIERVCLAAKIEPRELTVAFSHTHAAGLMDTSRADAPGGDLIAAYLESLAEEIAGAIVEATQAIAPVNIVYATGRCSLAAQRDFWDEQNQMFVCGFNPAAPADDTLLVGRITDATNKTVATIVNYACHPTTLAWDNQLISPDYIGAMREVVEAATGSPCIFLQGASGDLGPRHGFVGDVEAADRNGRQLGYAAVSAIESAPPANTTHRYQGPVVSGATIGVWRYDKLDEAQRDLKSRWSRERFTVALPYREGLPSVEETQRQFDDFLQQEQTARAAGNDVSAADTRALAERCRRQLVRLAALPAGDDFPFPVTLLRIGDAIWLLVEGEPYNQLQQSLRARFPDTPILLVELVNGSRCSYLPTAETYGKEIYQETIAVLQPGCLEALTDACERAIRAIG